MHVTHVLCVTPLSVEGHVRSCVFLCVLPGMPSANTEGQLLGWTRHSLPAQSHCAGTGLPGAGAHGHPTAFPVWLGLPLTQQALCTARGFGVFEWLCRKHSTCSNSYFQAAEHEGRHFRKRIYLSSSYGTQ